MAEQTESYDDSILNSVKKVLGLPPEVDDFDQDIIMHINSVLSILTQIGIGPESGFYISDSTASWSDFVSNDAKKNMVKSYVPSKVRLLFDPPSNSKVLEALEKVCSEFETRLNYQYEYETDTSQDSEGGDDDE